MSTCSNCSKPCATCDYYCHDNILPQLNRQRIFTSGYYVGEVEDDHPVPKPTNVMKCSHGGIIDKTDDLPAVGGINKDVKTSLLSPHDYDQETAANVAIQSTYLFLRKLWHLSNATHFGRMLELVPTTPSVTFMNPNAQPMLSVPSVRPEREWYSFYIDRSIQTLKLFVRTRSDQHFNSSDLFVTPDFSPIDDRRFLDSPTIKFAEIQRPKAGRWFFRANASMIRSFELTAVTSIRFLHSFSRLNLNLTHPGLYPIDGEPMQGEKIYSTIRIVSPDAEHLLFDQLEFFDTTDRLLGAYPLTQRTSTFYTSHVQIPSVDFHLRIVGRDERTAERIERWHSQPITPRALKIRLAMDTNVLRPGESARVNYTLIHHSETDEPIDVSITQTNLIFEIEHNSAHTNSFLLHASNDSDHIGRSSEISIVARHRSRSTWIDSYSFQAMIRPPASIDKLFTCHASFPSHYRPKELCSGSTETCSSRQWDILLNLTETHRIRSIVMTYYDSENILQSKKQSVVYRFDQQETSQTKQLMLTSNDCCRAYVDIVAYDRQGHRVTCLPLEPIAPS